MPEVGDAAPQFTLYDADRKPRQLAEFLGKGGRVILAFYPGAFTDVCTKELCTFRDMYTELQGLHGSVVGVSVDAPFSQKAFAEKNAITFPLLCDFKREVVRQYGVVWPNLGGVEGYDTANRAIFVIDSTGKIAYKWVAQSPGNLPDFEAIKRAL